MRVWLLIAFVGVVWGCGEQSTPAPSDISQGRSATPKGSPIATLPAKAPKTLDEALSLAGLPTLPGAEATGSGSGFALGSVPSDGSTRLSATFIAKESPEKVADFYKQKAGLEGTLKSGKGQLMGKSPTGGFVILDVEPAAGGSKIDVKAVVYPAKEPTEPATR